MREQRGMIFTYNKTENTEVKSEIQKKCRNQKNWPPYFNEPVSSGTRKKSAIV